VDGDGDRQSEERVCLYAGDARAGLFPVAHAEGKFFVQDSTVLAKLHENGQIVFRYCRPDGSEPTYPDNPNGSVDHIAGICDPTGRVLGLMPHPERHIDPTNPPAMDAAGFESGRRWSCALSQCGCLLRLRLFNSKDIARFSCCCHPEIRE
jgi:phosphoribosylformylglycinamidine (FGAM) synthase-like amidotransferase family enzyme